MVRSIIGLAACAATLSFPTPAKASFKTGNDLYQECTATQGTNTYRQSQAYCMGYIIGVADANGTWGSFVKRPFFCLSASVTTGQLVDVVVAYLQRHPENRHYAASSLIAGALVEAFPCPPAPATP